jgi:hypothetical protein
MADSDAVRAKRYRLHRQGDHSLCKGSCVRLTVLPDRELAGGESALAAAVRVEFAEADPLVAALAERLAEVASASDGPAAVAATKALAELTAAQRTKPPAAIRARIQQGRAG